MITSFEVGAVFKIVNQASPALAQILRQVRELNVAIDKARANLGSIGASATAGLGGAVGETQALAGAWREVAASAALATRNLNSASAAGRSAAAGGGGGGRHRPGWLGGGGGAHIAGPGVPIPGGGHARLRGPAMAALGAGAYAIYQAAQYDDAVVFMAQHAGVDLASNRTKFRKMLEDATIGTGFSEHDVSLAAQQELRMFGDTGGSNGVDVLPKMLRYAGTEARLKGTSLVESMSSLTGLSHMLQQYGEADVAGIAPAFSALSVRSPMTLAQQERAFGYAVPLLHSAMGLDPMQVMASSVALARAGITNTKAGTWIREMMVNAMPGTSLMSKMRFKKHEAALSALGLVDDQHNPTWFTDGKPDEMKFLAKTSEALPKIDIKERAAVLNALAGKQGAGAIAVLSEPAVRDQIMRMYDEMKNPANVNRVRNFMDVYNEQSTRQGARTAVQEFNVLMADLGDKALPAVNIGLHDFKAMLEGIRGILPGADQGKSGATIAARAAEGAIAGGVAGFFVGGVGAIPGAIGGGVLGTAKGFMEEYDHTTRERPGDRYQRRIEKLEEQNGTAKSVFPPISLNLNLDGRTLAQAMSTALAIYNGFPTQAPAADGLGHFNSGDHNHSDN